MTDKTYFVVGGVYKNTQFAQIADGYEEEQYGPFTSYRDAHDTWISKSWANVDDCHCRYTIRPKEEMNND